MAVLTLLGFASCTDPTEEDIPDMDYKIIGTVTDEAGTPVEGIRVVIPNVAYDRNRNCLVSDTLFTDSKGQYVSPKHNGTFPAREGMLFDDVDGEKNGLFLSQSLTPEDVLNAPSKLVKKEDGNLYDGVFEYTVDVTLKKQQE